MTMPTVKQLQSAWDRVLSTQSVAQSQIVDLYDKPWELIQAAEQVRLMDLALGNYVRLLAQAASILPRLPTFSPRMRRRSTGSRRCFAGSPV
jgi:hypothetical protein